MRTPSLMLLAAFVFAAPLQAQQPADKKLAADVDAFVQKIMVLEPTVGLAVTVVRGGDPLLVKGYGYADLEKKRPVTPNTGFYIASTTKAFTALTVAMMADHGYLNLDYPVSSYIPELKLAKGLNPDSITLRMLLTHTHGISNDGPVVWRTAFNGTPSDAELIRMMQFHAAAEYGHAYRYTNVGYNLAGLVIDRVAHGTWKKVMEAEVLKPLKMAHTSAYLSSFDSANLAMPYSATGGTGFTRLHYAKDDASMQAAGGLVTTATDMARWLEAQINNGLVDGKQVFPAKVMAETHRKQTDVNEPGEFKRTGYALGWMIADYNGKEVIMHTGGFSAFSAIVLFDPQTKLGVAVMVNEGKIGSGAGTFVAEYVLDRAAGTPGYEKKYDDLLARLPGMISQRRGGIKQDSTRRAGRPQTLPNPLAAYAGTFTHPEGGTFTVTVTGDRLLLQTGNLKAVAEAYDAATSRLRVELEPGIGEIVSYAMADGKAKSLEFRGMTFTKTK